MLAFGRRVMLFLCVRYRKQTEKEKEKMKGLTNAEVQERVQEGQVNTNEQPITRSYKQIILGNTLTFFNFLNITLFVLILLVGSYKNSMFMGVIICNTVIGIVQEIRAKKTIDELAIMTQAKTIVIRDDRKSIDRKTQVILRAVLLTGAVVCIIAGICNGGMQDVFVKAANICSECIGLG